MYYCAQGEGGRILRDYVIITDSSCDLPAGLAEELGLVVLPLSVQINGKTYENYLDEREISFTDFYGLLKDGKMGKTSAANIESFISYMEPIVKSGRDVLYLGFSSGLSGTYGVGAIAAEELSEKYPDSKIYTVDIINIPKIREKYI